LTINLFSKITNKKMLLQNKEFSETDLINRLRQGNDDAYKMLIDNYSAMLFGVIGRIVKDYDDAQNILQDSFVKIWMNIENYDASKGRLATWILNIARNTAIDFTRSKIYSQRSKNQNIEHNVSLESVAFMTQTHIDAIGLRQIVDTLPQNCREIIEWMYFEGFTQQEIADNMGIPLGTVKTRTRTALIELRKYYIE
jgi:RNA polymerase sigma-70 factor, ECF subfamily